MDINFEKGTINLYGKNVKLDTLIKKLTQLSGEQVYHFLSNRGIQLPRKLNCLALMSVLNRRIKFLHSNSLSKDYFSRLQYYHYFTEQQLFNLYQKICNDEETFFAYRYNFFKILLANFVGLNLNDGELTYLRNVKKNQVESFEQYFNFISGAALEQENTFDGQDLDILKEKLVVSATNQEIFDLAGKYGINLPARLKKDDYLAFIFYYMKNNKLYNDEIAEELSLMTLSQLTTYARRVGVPMQPAMSKSELITYLFYYLEQCQIEQTSVRRLEIPEEFVPLEFTVDLSAVSTFGSDELKKVIHYPNEENDHEVFNQILIDASIDENDEIEDEEPAVSEEGQAVEEPSADEVASSDPSTISDEVEYVEAEEIKEESNALGEEVEYVEAEEIEESDALGEEVEYVEVEEIEEESVALGEEVEDVEVEEIEESDALGEEVEYVEVEYIDEDSQATKETDEVEQIEVQEIDEDYVDDETIAQLLAQNNANVEPNKTIHVEFDNVIKNEHYGSEKIENLAKGPGKIIMLSICGTIALAVLVFCIWALLS